MYMKPCSLLLTLTLWGCALQDDGPAPADGAVDPAAGGGGSGSPAPGAERCSADSDPRATMTYQCAAEAICDKLTQCDVLEALTITNDYESCVRSFVENDCPALDAGGSTNCKVLQCEVADASCDALASGSEDGSWTNPDTFQACLTLLGAGGGDGARCSVDGTQDCPNLQTCCNLQCMDSVNCNL